MAKILIIDDNLGIVDLLCYILDTQGFQTITASTSEAGIGLIKTDTDISLVFCDLHMDEIDGIGVLKVVHSMNNANDRFVNFVIVTADDSSKDLLDLAKTYGAKAWLTKPFDPQVILQIAEKFTGQPKQTD